MCISSKVVGYICFRVHVKLFYRIVSYRMRVPTQAVDVVVVHIDGESNHSNEINMIRCAVIFAIAQLSCYFLVCKRLREWR